MEAAGIAPASRDPSMKASTCVSDSLIVGLDAPIGRVVFSLSHHEFNPSRNGWLGSDDPALSSSGEASGRRPATKPFLLLRQPYGKSWCSWQIKCGPLFTRPADQPRHATIHVSNPVDPGRRILHRCRTLPAAEPYLLMTRFQGLRAVKTSSVAHKLKAAKHRRLPVRVGRPPQDSNWAPETCGHR
jgi:hypothetical protein